MLNPFRFPSLFALHNRSLRCGASARADADMERYREAFARRMAMAGVKPHHRIAVGVSGGADSMGLCALAAGWKNDAAVIRGGEGSGCVDALWAVVVDHRLRPESSEEAERVCNMVSRMGVRCEVASCNWMEGLPKPGKVQEAAREMRYQLLQDVCVRKRIGVLLVAHHGDDQAELFILRLSRNSGVLGLAGMAFMSQLFSPRLVYSGKDIINPSVLLVRPLLDFSKDDMYSICKGFGQDWVEDPTNQKPVFARNRIRMSLNSVASCTFKSELQAVISECRKARAFFEQICCKLIDDTVTIIPHGYAVIDLKKLNESDVGNVCLSKCLALVLQFVSQRHKPIRGTTMQLLLNYIRDFPCKTSLTVAGCYLCPAPRTKGANLVVCYSPDSSQSSRTKTTQKFSIDAYLDTTSELESIISEAKANAESVVQQRVDLPFLHVSCSESIISEAMKLNLLSKSSCHIIDSLQKEEAKYFYSDTKIERNYSTYRTSSSSSSVREPLHYGHFCYFLDRFLVQWKISETVLLNKKSPMEVNDFNWDSNDQAKIRLCNCSIVNDHKMAVVRLMIDDDWMQLSELSKGHIPVVVKEFTGMDKCPINMTMDRTNCVDYLHQSAGEALQALKSIPISARRALPVLVSSQGLLLSIPSVSYNCCPHLSVIAAFRPRIPITGGFTSFI